VTNHELAETLRELMAEYNERKPQWIAKYGSEEGFDKWFLGQIEQAGGFNL
jgi:hypothetical protein